MKNRKRVFCLAFAMILLAANDITVPAAAADTADTANTEYGGVDSGMGDGSTAPYTVTNNDSDSDKKIAINNRNFNGLKAFAKKQDTDGDGYLSTDELRKVFRINDDTNQDGKVDVKITGLGGIENFPNVDSVTLLKYSKSKLTIPKSSSVKWLTLYDVNTKSLKIDAPGVQSIDLKNKKFSFKRKLKKIDISNCSSLVHFDNNYCSDYITQLKLPKQKNNLRSISLYKMKCNSLNLSKYKNLQEVTVLVSTMKSVNLSKCKKLLYVYFYNCGKLKSVKVNKASKLRHLNWYGCSSLKKSRVKTAGKGKIAGGKGMYWINTKKYSKFYSSLY